jgi:hypothetical protein
MSLHLVPAGRSFCAGMIRRVQFVAFLWIAAAAAQAQTQLWSRQLGTGGLDWARAAASDGSGGVYLGGYTTGTFGGTQGSHDAWVARYDSRGNRLWLRQFGSSAGDTVDVAAPDGAGGVYLGGFTYGALGGANAGVEDVWIARYDGAGNQLWVRQMGSTLHDYAYAAATDGAGGLYVGGTGSFGVVPFAYDAWIARYDGGGNQVWLRTFATYSSFVGGCASDGSGGVFVSGTTGGSLAGKHFGYDDAWLARYDAAGNQLWARQLGTGTYDYAFTAAPDGMGGLYVGGDTYGNLGGSHAGNGDAWLAHYDGAGNQDWIRQFGTPAYDTCASAAAATGGIFVGGSTKGSLGGSNSGLMDVWLARYDSGGNRAWLLQLGTSLNEILSAGAPDGSGGLYVGGMCNNSFGGTFVGGYHDAWLARYESSCSTTYSYCSAKMNSSLCLPSITVSGTPSASAGSGFTIRTSDVLANKFGRYLYSKSGPSSVPYQGGKLCVQAPVLMTLQNSGGSGACGGSIQIDFNAYVASGKDPGLSAGQQVWIQTWSRDPGFAPPDNTSLSDAISFTLCP